MIHAVLIFNTSGIPRLTKFYTPLHQSSQTVIQKIFSLISVRPAGLCNFLDAPELEHSSSELGILDLIQVLVEALDRAFENVCELDLVFHFDEAHHILAEIIQGGLVLETNVDEISNSAKLASKGRKDSFMSANPLALGSGVGGPRNGALQAPLGWLTDRLTGVSGR
ncbi:Adaptor protein complex sigma subunit [Melanogaster broomeanus]|nr:Adaptor protein complex sigma subunit [Melanogaster broomeanus]